MFYVQFANETKEQAIRAGGHETYDEATCYGDDMLEYEPKGMYYTIIEAPAVGNVSPLYNLKTVERSF